MRIAADQLWERLGICDKNLESPLPLWLGPYFLCGLHLKDDIEAAWRAREPRGKPMMEADVRPGVVAAVLYELWKRLHRYHLVLPDGNFKQVMLQGAVRRPVPNEKSETARAQKKELLQFNLICSRRFEKLGNKWWSPQSWFQLEEGRCFFGKEISELTHLLTGVSRSSCNRAVHSPQRAAADEDAALERIFADRDTNVMSTRETLRILQVDREEGSADLAAAPAAARSVTVGSTG